MSNIDDLLKLVYEDKEKINTYDRYPVRFLFTNLGINTNNDIDEFQTKYMEEKNNNSSLNVLTVIELKSILTYDDAWITRNQLYNYIMQLDDNKDYLILGFSELARFYSKQDFHSLIISLMTDKESKTQKNKQRIYFLCFSLLDEIKSVLQYNGRNKNIDPIILDPSLSKESMNVYYANIKGTFNNYSNIIENSSKWLSLYSQENINYNKDIICISETLSYVYENAKPDHFIEINKIDSDYSVLDKFYKLNFKKVKKENFDKYFWALFLKKFIELKSKSLNKFTYDYFGINKINNEIFMSYFNKGDLFQKQLLHLFLIENNSNIEQADYIISLLNDSKEVDYSNFLQLLVVRFDIFTTKSELNARKDIIDISVKNKHISRDDYQEELKLTYEKMLNNYLISKINVIIHEEKIEDITSEYYSQKYGVSKKTFQIIFNQFIKEYFYPSITNNSISEEIIIMMFLKNQLITVEDACEMSQNLNIYLGNIYNEYIDKNMMWINEYIYEYKLSKLLSIGTERFVSLANKNTEDFMFNWYFNSNYSHQHELLTKVSFDKVVVFDGVGVEYFDYLIAKIKEKGRYINFATYSKAYIPTITSINKKEILNYDEWVVDFDKDNVHGNTYNNYKTIPNALNKLNLMLNNVLVKYPDKKVCIIADHGVTCQSKLISTSKKYDYKESEHEGRCMKIDGNLKYPKSDDYAIINDITNNDNYMVALKNVSLYNNPSRECHGGATLEETFVPCIIFSNKENDIIHTVNILKDTVNGLDKKISFNITPKPETNPIIIEDDNEYSELKYSNNLWSCTIKNVRSQRIKLKIGDEQFSFDIKSSSGITTIGDDGFDD